MPDEYRISAGGSIARSSTTLRNIAGRIGAGSGGSVTIGDIRGRAGGIPEGLPPIL